VEAKDMPIQVQWHSQQQYIIRYTFESDWTSAELRSATYESVVMMRDCAPQCVHMIVDLIRTHTVPQDLFSQAPFITSQIQPNRGLIAVVNSPTITTHLLRLMLPLLPALHGHIHMVDTIAEAERLIAVARIATGEVEPPDNWAQLVC
jgi:hypothetical protein